MREDLDPGEFENFKGALLTEIGRLIKDFEYNWDFYLEYNRLTAACSDLQVTSYDLHASSYYHVKH